VNAFTHSKKQNAASSSHVTAYASSVAHLAILHQGFHGETWQFFEVPVPQGLPLRHSILRLSGKF
jgi:hypothetical protein